MADMKKTINLLETAMRYNSIGLGRIVVHHDTISDALELLKSQQAEIERLQPKKGHWEMKDDPFGLFDEIPVCSVCGCTNDMRKKTAFCEHCGADMREGDGDGNHS